MRKIILIVLSVVVFSAVAAGGVASLQPAPDLTLPIWSHCYGGTSSGCDQLYTDNITQNVRYRFLNDLKTPVVDRPASIDEVSVYDGHIQNIERVNAISDLSADIEFNKKAVEILREWSTQAMDINTTWDTLTPTQKDSRMKELFRRNAIFWDKYADDLVTRGLGQ